MKFDLPDGSKIIISFSNPHPIAWGLAAGFSIHYNWNPGITIFCMLLFVTGSFFPARWIRPTIGDKEMLVNSIDEAIKDANQKGEKKQ